MLSTAWVWGLRNGADACAGLVAPVSTPVSGTTLAVSPQILDAGLVVGVGDALASTAHIDVMAIAMAVRLYCREPLAAVC